MATAATILYTLSFLLYQTSTATAVPANAVSSTPALSLTQPNTSTTEVENLTSSDFLSPSAASSCPLNSLPQARPQRYVVWVGGTLTHLNALYCPDPTIDRDDIERVLDVAFAAMTNHINAHGDGALLPPRFDPYVTPRVSGVDYTVTAKSADDSPYRLTFQVMVNVLRWLYEFLYDENRPGAVIVSVMDEGVQPDLEKLGIVCVGPCGD